MSIQASVLIRTKNEANDLPKALELIRRQSVQPVDIVVVDSGSTDGTVEIIQQQADVKLIQMPPEQFTFGRSLNLGFTRIEGDVVISISAHAFPCDTTWLESLIKPFDDPRVAGVYGKQVSHPDAWPPVQRDYLNCYREQAQIQTCSEEFSDHRFSNANSAIRSTCWQQRAFNEALTGGEDREWAKAMLELGHTIVYEPQAAVYHSHNETLQQVFRRTYRETLAHQAIYPEGGGRIMSLSIAFKMWYRSVKGDLSFIRAQGKEYVWLMRSPLYRLYWVYGFLKPSLPGALWKPFVKRWRKWVTPNQAAIEQ